MKLPIFHNKKGKANFGYIGQDAASGAYVMLGSDPDGVLDTVRAIIVVDLNKDCYTVYANGYCKWIQGYKISPGSTVLFFKFGTTCNPNPEPVLYTPNGLVAINAFEPLAVTQDVATDLENVSKLDPDILRMLFMVVEVL